MCARIERGDTDNSEETVVEFDLDTIVPVNTRVRVLYDDGILFLLCVPLLKFWKENFMN